MDVKVKYYAMTRDMVGKKNEIITLPPGSRVKDLLKLLVSRYGPDVEKYIFDEKKRFRGYFSYMLNGVNIHSLRGYDTPLECSDEFSLLPPIGGGVKR